MGIALAVTLVAASSSAQAQSFPAKPIRIYVGQGAGGGMDTLARMIGARMQASLGQAVIIDNKVGAGGIIATDFVAKAPADGYSLLMGPIGNMVFTPVLVPKLRYSPIKDFVPVSLVATFPLVLVVNAKQPINSVADLVAFMKANPAKSNYGGSGPAFQFASELFRLKTGAPGEFIQYKSMSETLTALMAGDLLMAMVDTGPATPALASGNVRALAVTSPRTPARAAASADHGGSRHAANRISLLGGHLCAGRHAARRGAAAGDRDQPHCQTARSRSANGGDSGQPGWRHIRRAG